MTLKGYADPDVGRAYARVLCQQVEDTPVLWGLWLYDFARGALRSGTAVGGVIRLSTVTGGRGHIWTSKAIPQDAVAMAPLRYRHARPSV
jgi:hypothetical protein